MRRAYTSELITNQKVFSVEDRERWPTQQAMSCPMLFGWRYLPNVWNDIDYVA
jgi:hypothetical protein